MQMPIDEYWILPEALSHYMTSIVFDDDKQRYSRIRNYVGSGYLATGSREIIINDPIICCPGHSSSCYAPFEM